VQQRPPYPPADRDERPLRAGQVVRIVGTPDLGDMSEDARRESAPVFEHLLGRYEKVAGITDLGLVELSFRIAAGPHAGLHTVWIEPHLLRVRRSRP